MADSSTVASTSLAAMFAIPGPGDRAESPREWKSFQDRLASEIKSVKTASLPDLTPKIGELFNIEIPDILVSSWKKTLEVRVILDKSRTAPDDTFWAGLAEHTVNSEHHPYVDIKIKGQTVKRIEFTIRLSFKLNSFVLKIQQGEIREIQTGTCDMKGVIEYQGITVAEKELAPITLPGVVVLQKSPSLS